MILRCHKDWCKIKMQMNWRVENAKKENFNNSKMKNNQE